MSAISPHMALWVVILCVLLWGALWDLRERIIPDHVSVLIVICALTLSWLVRWADIKASMVMFAFIFAGMCILGYFDLVGGGDVKLISAVSLLVPSGQVGTLLAEIAIAGGMLSCIYLLARLYLQRHPAFCRAGGTATSTTPTEESGLRREAARIIASEPMPYAFAILGGVVFHRIWELCL